MFQHVGGVLQPALQGRHDQRGHVAAVPHGEGALHLQGSYEGEQEHFVVDQLAKQLQGLLHILLAISRNLDRRRQDKCRFQVFLTGFKRFRKLCMLEKTRPQFAWIQIYFHHDLFVPRLSAFSKGTESLAQVSGQTTEVPTQDE